MARGAVSKSLVFKKILDTFEGAFPYNGGKELRIPMIEDGEEIQIKVALTAAKENVNPGDEDALPGAAAVKESNAQLNFEDKPKVTVEATEEEKQIFIRTFYDILKQEKRSFFMKEKSKWIIIVSIILFIFCISCGIFATRIREVSQDINSEEVQTQQGQIEETNNLEELSINEEVQEEEPIESEQEEILYTTTAVNLRADASIESDVITVLSINTEVTKIGEKDDWAKIKWSDGNIYYIKGTLLSTEKTIIKQQTTTNSVTSRANTLERSTSTSGTTSEYQSYAHDKVLEYGWTEYDYECLVKLWNRESGWNPNSHNSSSGAHGIPQALPASKMASEGSDYYTNGYTQIRWGLKYIKSRYGSPSSAWSHFLSHNWF